MQDEQSSIFELSLLGFFNGLSLIGMKYLHSSRAMVRFRQAPATEVPLWSWGLIPAVLVAYLLIPGIIALALEDNLDIGLHSEEGSFSASSLAGGYLLGGGLVAFFIWQHVVGTLRQPPATLGICGAPLANLPPFILFYGLFFPPLLLLGILWAGLLEKLGHEAVPQEAVRMFTEAFSRGEGLEIALLVFNAVVLAPLWEELMFRGVFFGLLRSRSGTGSALVLSSAVFAAYHLSLDALLPLFFVGLALGYIYYRTRSIYFAILFHALFNSVMLFIQWLLAGS